MSDVDDILSFWIEPAPKTEAELETRKQFWFGSSSAELDKDIERRFGGLVERAHAGELDAWKETMRGTLALVILIDQFSRNIYRGSAKAFAADDKALSIVRAGYDAGLFDELDPVVRIFAALPFRHAEDIPSQKRAVDLAVDDALAGLPFQKDFLIYSVDWARKHLDVIVRFGRFPHRNAALGRQPTSKEVQYLKYLKFAGQWL
jgi:uncharacterized protein (DUF924 family)